MKLSFKALTAAFFASAALSLGGCGTDSAVLPNQPNLVPVAPLGLAQATGNIGPSVDNFRNQLGATNNGAGASVVGGRREINWDGVPAGVTNTNTFPGDFFSVNSTRGAIFTTPGSGFRVADNNFSTVDVSYGAIFNVFSPV